jgi:hypothetical protein
MLAIECVWGPVRSRGEGWVWASLAVSFDGLGQAIMVVHGR